jgi:TIR domain/Prenyltransferase and squalene oxidase repeat
MVAPKIFLSYNSQDAREAHELADLLRARAGIQCWLDAWSLVPGRTWQEDIEQALAEAVVMLVAIGSSGFGAWNHQEFRAALDLYAHDPEHRRIIPVLLPSYAAGPPDLPAFLARFTYVDFRGGINPDQFGRLLAGIRGVAPGPSNLAIVPNGYQAMSARDREALTRTTAALTACARWAEDVQNADGGLPSDAAGSLSCTWATAGLIFAVNQSDGNTSALWRRRALNWVLENRNDDGGAPFVAKGDPSITDATAQTLLATLSFPNPSRRGLMNRATPELADWLVSHQQPSGGWAWRAGPSRPLTISTAFALLALGAATSEEDLAQEVRSSLDSGLEWLIGARNTDGGWGREERELSEPAPTGIVTYVLASLGHGPIASESAEYIIGAQDRDGSWASTIDRPAGHSVIRFGTAYALCGLARMRDFADSKSLRRGLASLWSSFRGSHFRYENSIMATWPTRDGVLALAAVRASLLNPYQ